MISSVNASTCKVANLFNRQARLHDSDGISSHEAYAFLYERKGSEKPKTYITWWDRSRGENRKIQVARGAGLILEGV